MSIEYRTLIVVALCFVAALDGSTVWFMFMLPPVTTSLTTQR